MKTKAYLYIITAAVCWGLIGLFVRTLAAQGFNSMQIVALRSLAAAICVTLPLLRSGRLDVAIGSPPESSTTADLQITPLFVDNMVWVIAPQHPLASSACISLKDLQPYIWVMTPRIARRRALVDAALRRHGVTASEHVVETLSHEIILGLVLQQNAAALVMSRVARSFESRGLVRVLDIEMRQTLQVAAFTWLQPPPSAFALELVGYLTEQAASPLASGVRT